MSKLGMHPAVPCPRRSRIAPTRVDHRRPVYCDTFGETAPSTFVPECAQRRNCFHHAGPVSARMALAGVPFVSRTLAVCRAAWRPPSPRSPATSRPGSTPSMRMFPADGTNRWTRIAPWSLNELDAAVANCARPRPPTRLALVERALVLHADIAILHREAGGYNLPAGPGERHVVQRRPRRGADVENGPLGVRAPAARPRARGRRPHCASAAVLPRDERRASTVGRICGAVGASRRRPPAARRGCRAALVRRDDAPGIRRPARAAVLRRKAPCGGARAAHGDHAASAERVGKFAGRGRDPSRGASFGRVRRGLRPSARFAARSQSILRSPRLAFALRTCWVTPAAMTRRPPS